MHLVDFVKSVCSSSEGIFRDRTIDITTADDYHKMSFLKYIGPNIARKIYWN
jgi:hypothetical protein